MSKIQDLWIPAAEKCGFVLSDGTIMEVPNVHPEPQNNFCIPAETILEYADQIRIIWHTHTTDEVNLSVEDYHAFLNYPDYEHQIYTQYDMASYYVRENLVYRRD